MPPLALPWRPPPPPTAEQLAPYAAVRLFVERAQAGIPGQASSWTTQAPPRWPRSAGGSTACHWRSSLRPRGFASFFPEALLERLEKHLPFLTGGARDSPVRQRTLRDAIAWSHDLLDPEEQSVFRRLAVFTGGFALEAAEAVVNPGGELDVLGLVERLCEHSLLRTGG